jgi:hypothetical protein
MLLEFRDFFEVLSPTRQDAPLPLVSQQVHGDQVVKTYCGEEVQAFKNLNFATLCRLETYFFKNLFQFRDLYSIFSDKKAKHLRFI